MSENTPNNPSQGAAGGYGYDAGAHPAQDASLPGQAAQPGNAAQVAQPSQPVQSSQQGNVAQSAAPVVPQQPVQPQQAPQPAQVNANAQPNTEAASAQPGQPAAAPQPGAAQPGVAPQPGAAQPGQPGQATYAPSAPHPAVKALGATWNAFLDVFSSNPATAHARISSAGAWGWIVPTTLQALVGAFFFSQLVILAATVAMSMMGYMYGRGGAYGGAYASQAVPTGRMILAYVLMALAIFGVQVLRGVQLQLTARIGKAPASFTASMHAVSVSSLALIPSFLVLNLLVFFMTLSRSGDGASFLTMLMVLVLAFAVFSGEALTYLGLNRLGRFAKSPIIMHAALSTAWVLASMIVYYVAIRLMGA
ncbi:hypothetical protein HMPREF2836_01040 [Rothia sp. HMSC065C12]|uniref:hypothetical protein n=1 Tax=unclassified Rothia (in: high G+C Gram-positive bacteria) TaxID=2689056 RepID=UPI0008A17BDC|nr:MULTISPECIES: hypothetical protein [unclassified Rothia (in: high G+C Gram-positive bacteria)]OFJ97542.1 hypothetical protein HMPREF2836_01040 [Rothia sp. HMSC065C12]OFR46398.1 hypothetical protein HMPREF2884_08720 [Rothia sp. HMSC073B08]